MDLASFSRILTAFVDCPANLDLAKGSFIVEVRDEVIEATIALRQGELTVTENGDSMPASRWLIQRIARLPLLAERILTHTAADATFVSPDGFLMDQIDESPDEEDRYVSDAASATRQLLDRRPAGVASVLYLTSDAGEGKTTVISHLARQQAQLYKEKKTDWLLVPVPLGGRTFMRFDDVIVGSLMNRLRFNLLFYDAFIELVRLGVVVPALDGFEEMFVEGSAGDAMSALGTLMQALQSSGSVLIAARKAYFEFKSLRAQTRLFDSLGGQSVSFSRLALKRWDKNRFLEYASKRRLGNGEQVYGEVVAQLGEDHPLVTRAVLVRRLLDIASEPGGSTTLLERIKHDPSDYFRQFIGSIIVREAKEKWIDKVGEPAQPLITESEHYELLALLAFEMWTNATENLAGEILEFVAEMFADSKRKDKATAHQIVERVKQHALIVRADGGRYAFDHPEFYHFFLGEVIGQMLIKGDAVGIKHAFRQAVLPQLAVETAARFVARNDKSITDVISVVTKAFVGEPRVSVVKENLCGVAINLISLAGGENVTIGQGSFPPDALKGRHLSDITFSDCYFQRTTLDHTAMARCRFVNCEFEGLEMRPTTTLEAVELTDCLTRMAIPLGEELAVFAPDVIGTALTRAGFTVKTTAPQVVVPLEEPVDAEENVLLIARVVRAFMRSTGVNENTINKRLRAKAGMFFRDVLPELVERGIVREVAYRGVGDQRRFELGVRLEVINDALENCEGRLDRFLEMARQPPG